VVVEERKVQNQDKR